VPVTAADQRHREQQKACNGGVYCHDQMKLKQSIGYLLAKLIIGFIFDHRLMEARLTSLDKSKQTGRYSISV